MVAVLIAWLSSSTPMTLPVGQWFDYLGMACTANVLNTVSPGFN